MRKCGTSHRAADLMAKDGPMMHHARMMKMRLPSLDPMGQPVVPKQPQPPPLEVDRMLSHKPQLDLAARPSSAAESKDSSSVTSEHQCPEATPVMPRPPAGKRPEFNRRRDSAASEKDKEKERSTGRCTPSTQSSKSLEKKNPSSSQSPDHEWLEEEEPLQEQLSALGLKAHLVLLEAQSEPKVLSKGNSGPVGMQAALSVPEAAEANIVLIDPAVWQSDAGLERASDFLCQLGNVRPGRPVTTALLPKRCVNGSRGEMEQAIALAKASSVLCQAGALNSMMLPTNPADRRAAVAVAAAAARTQFSRRAAYRRQIFERDEQCSQLFWKNAHEIIPDFPAMQAELREAQWSQVGTRILDQCVGQGAYGRVYISRNADTNVDEAIKVYQKSRINRVKYVMSIISEFTILDRLRHPNIVEVHNLIHGRYNIYLFMEMGGTSLAKVIRSEGGKLTPEKAQVVFAQASNGIAYCHAQGVAHRDLKPENMVVAPNAHVKLIDFGMAVEVAPDYEADEDPCGTIPFMSPESMNCKCSDPMGSDIFAFGVVLVEMLFGIDKLVHKLGWDKTQMKPDSKHTGEYEAFLSAPNAIQSLMEPDLGSGVSGNLSKVIAGMLSLVPKDRPKAAAVAEVNWWEGPCPSPSGARQQLGGGWAYSPRVSVRPASRNLTPGGSRFG